MPKVSVIIPAYNAESTILETIESIRSQTLKDFEILVIDDGSKDRTLEIVNSVHDPRLKIFSYSNSGVSVARNRGIEQSTGDFLTFIDNDDLWTEDKLELQVAALENNPDADAVYSWTVNMVKDGQSISFSRGTESKVKGNIYQELLLGNFIGSGSNILIRRKVIDTVGGFAPDLAFSDWDFCLRIAVKFNFEVVPKPQILYRQVSGSMSSRAKKMEEEGLKALERAYATAPSDLQHLKKISLALLYRYCAGLCLAHTANVEGLQYAQAKLWEAIKLHPYLLQEKYARNLIVKLLIRRLFPRSLSDSLISSLKRLSTCPDPRLDSRFEKEYVS